jgi:hypothetical protein
MRVLLRFTQLESRPDSRLAAAGLARHQEGEQGAVRAATARTRRPRWQTVSTMAMPTAITMVYAQEPLKKTLDRISMYKAFTTSAPDTAT